MNTSRIRRTGLIAAAAVLGGTMLVGATAPAFAAPTTPSSPTATQHVAAHPAGDPVKNFWARGVAITIRNYTPQTMTVTDVTTDGQPQTTLRSGQSTMIDGDVVDNDGSSINFGTAHIQTERGKFTVQGMNGSILEPSFHVDKGNSRVWSAGYFSVGEAKAADNIDGYRFWVKRLADDPAGADYSKHFELIIGPGQ